MGLGSISGVWGSRPFGDLELRGSRPWGDLELRGYLGLQRCAHQHAFKKCWLSYLQYSIVESFWKRPPKAVLALIALILEST